MRLAHVGAALNLKSVAMANKPEAKAYFGVSHSQLSIAKHYGGAKLNGVEYKYYQEHDALVRADLVSKLKKHIKSGNTFESFFTDSDAAK